MGRLGTRAAEGRGTVLPALGPDLTLEDVPVRRCLLAGILRLVFVLYTWAPGQPSLRRTCTGGTEVLSPEVPPARGSVTPDLVCPRLAQLRLTWERAQLGVGAVPPPPRTQLDGAAAWCSLQEARAPLPFG